MKYSILLLVLISQLAVAECSMRKATNMADQHVVGAIRNLTKDKSMGRCTVSFDITVDGVDHHLTETEKGLEQEEALCYYARERARSNLLLDLPSKFTAESITVCSDGKLIDKKISIGDLVLEREIGASPIKKEFTYLGTKCRMFQERKEDGHDVLIYNGVICQINNNPTNWLVVDKW
jgi:hypothetical protein